MSRTYKDKPVKSSWDSTHEAVPYIRTSLVNVWGDVQSPEGRWYKDIAGIKPKLRKEVDTEDHWMTTPSWWNNLAHTRPLRGKFRNYTKNVVRCPIEYIDDLVEPLDSNRPHKCFW